MIQSKNDYVYIMANILWAVLYIGVTNNIDHKIWKLTTSQSKFTSVFNCNPLVYYELITGIRVAMRKQWLMKRWWWGWKTQVDHKNESMNDRSTISDLNFSLGEKPRGRGETRPDLTVIKL
ncbi:MAG: hypothetical protein EOO01_01700 [Chitinophagaceae bacterium]|nr:MAG: hypothetical protein EOO01_01700 [Chitinophagaceae bacterium]